MIICYKDIEHDTVQRVEVLEFLPKRMAKVRIIQHDMTILEIKCKRSEIAGKMYKGDFKKYNL